MLYGRKKLNTMANLVGGILMGITGYAAMEVHRAYFTEFGSTIPFWLSWVSAVCFYLLGWKSLGHNAGFGGINSVSSGLRTMLLALMTTCIVFGMIYMGQQLVQGNYLDPFKTIFDWFRISFDFFVDTFSIPVWTTLVVGSAISGWLTGISNYRWR